MICESKIVWRPWNCPFCTGTFSRHQQLELVVDLTLPGTILRKWSILNRQRFVGCVDSLIMTAIMTRGLFHLKSVIRS